MRDRFDVPTRNLGISSREGGIYGAVRWQVKFVICGSISIYFGVLREYLRYGRLFFFFKLVVFFVLCL